MSNNSNVTTLLKIEGLAFKEENLTNPESNNPKNVIQEGNTLTMSDIPAMQFLYGQLPLIAQPIQPVALTGVSPLVNNENAKTLEQAVIDEFTEKGFDIGLILDELESPEAGEEVATSGGADFLFINPLYSAGIVTAGYPTKGIGFSNEGNQFEIFFFDNSEPLAALSFLGDSLNADESLRTSQFDPNAGDNIGVSDPFNIGPLIGYATGFLTSTSGSQLNQSAAQVSSQYALSINKQPTQLFDINQVPIELVEQGDQIIGQANGVVVFIAGVDSDTGKLTLAQYQPLFHFNPSNPDDPIILKGLIDLTYTLTDFNGDESSATVDIGTKLVIEDSGPDFLTVDNQAFSEVNRTNLYQGTIEVDFDSDGAFEFRLVDTTVSALESLNLTSNGYALRYELSSDGQTVRAFRVNNGDLIFQFELNAQTPLGIPETTTYDFQLFAALDQPLDTFTIPLPVIAVDRDGDEVIAELLITTLDGQPGQGANEIAVSIREGNLPPSGAPDYPVESSSTTTISAGADSDRIDPTTLMVGANDINQLLNELENDLTTNGGEPLTFTLTNNVIIGSDSNQNEIVRFDFSAVQNANQFDADLTVLVRQSAPLDHFATNNNPDFADGFVQISDLLLSVLIPIQLQDTDGDLLLQDILVSARIEDGTDPVLANEISVVLSETEDQTSGNLGVTIGSDAIDSIQFSDIQPSFLDSITSDGYITSYSLSPDRQTFTLFNDIGDSILIVTLDDSGQYQVDLTGPIDQPQGANPKIISIPLNIMTVDKDGDSDSATLTIPINDGPSPSNTIVVNQQLQEDLLENPNSVTVTTSPIIRATSDRLDISTLTLVNETDLLNELEAELTSANAPVTASVNNNVIEVRDVNGDLIFDWTFDPVQIDRTDVRLDVTFNLYQPIDHITQPPSGSNNFVDFLTDLIRIETQFQIQDTDGNLLPNSIQILASITDGADPANGGPIILEVTEGTLNPNTYPQSDMQTIGVFAGSDDIKDSTFSIVDLNNLLNELNGLTSGGQSMTFTYDANSLSIIGVRDSDQATIITLDFDLTNAPNGVDRELKLTTTLEGPLDHIDNSGNHVQIINDQIIINFNTSITDFDNDPTLFSSTVIINDGDDGGGITIIVPGVTAEVEESDIDGLQGNIPGTTSNEQNETVTGTITVVNIGSDPIGQFNVDINAFNTNPPTSDGLDVLLSYNASTETYEGRDTNNTLKFTLKIETNGSDGTFTFVSYGGLDHDSPPANPDTDFNSLTLNFDIQAVSTDGDLSNNVTLPVNIIDDVTIADDYTISVEEGENSNQIDIMPTSHRGADEGFIEKLISIDQGNGIPSDVNLVNGFNVVDIYEDNDSSKQFLGVLRIHPDGRTRFFAQDDIDHDSSGVIEVQLSYQAVDDDFDRPQGVITLSIYDGVPTINIDNVTGLEDSTGIPFMVSIDLGDIDNSETLDSATIEIPANGTIELNGIELTDIGGGLYEIPTSAFSSSMADPDVLVSSGLTFVPDGDFSSATAIVNLDVDAVVTSDVGTFNLDDDFVITVEGIADKPTISADDYYLIDEDTSVTLSNIVGTVTDIDGSENIQFYTLSGSGEFTVSINGMPQAVTGPWHISPNDIDNVTIIPTANFSGQIDLSITATTREATPFNVEFAESDPLPVKIDVAPVADDIRITGGRIRVNEDTVFVLTAAQFNLSSFDDNTDGSETLFVRFDDYDQANGAEVRLNGNLVPEGGEVAYADIVAGNVTFLPPVDSNVDYSLQVTGINRDTAVLSTGPDVSDKEEPSQIEVIIKGVPDEADFVPNGPDWTVIGGNIETIIEEDASTTLGFIIDSGEVQFFSETVTAVISGIPEDVTVTELTPDTLRLVGLDGNNQPIYEVPVNQLDQIQITPPLHSTEDITLDVQIVVTENDGGVLVENREILIKVVPVIDAVDFNLTSQGLEFNDIPVDGDRYTVVNWQPTAAQGFVDSQEEITSLTFDGIPAGYDLSYAVGGTETAIVNGTALTAPQLAALLAGNAEIRLRGPADSDMDITLTTTMTVIQNNFEGNTLEQPQASKTITGNLLINLVAEVEADADLIVTVPPLVSNEIDLSPPNIVFEQNDLTPSDEVIKTMVIEFPDSAAGGFLVEGGIRDHEGNWTIQENELNNLSITAPNGFTGTVDVTINAQIQDIGEDNDPSALVVRSQIVTLDFSGNTLSETGEASTLAVNTDPIIGDEDNTVFLGDQLDDRLTIDYTNSADDTITVVIDAGSLPPGVTISGTEFDFVNNRYVFETSLTDPLDLSAIILNLPPDYAEVFTPDIHYVITDKISGDVETLTEMPTVDIAPIVDIPDVDISVISAPALEDEVSELSFSITFGDTDQANGTESIVFPMTLSLAPSDGHFTDAFGNNPTQITQINSLADPVYFKPLQDFAGTVPINVSFDIQDVTSSQTDVQSFNTFVSIDIEPVNDPVLITALDVNGDEDTVIQFNGLTVETQDIDGSESIVSVVITGVPEGFVINNANNLGGGEWRLDISDFTSPLDLSSFAIKPPLDFSGQLTLGVKVFTQEDLGELPVSFTDSFDVTVDPVGDFIVANVITPESGEEGDILSLTVDVNVLDDILSTALPTENPPETIRITVTNVPESASFSVATGTAVEIAPGTWQIEVPAQQLDTVEFDSGDSHGQIVLDFAFQSNDNGTLGPVNNQSVTVNLAPKADMPTLLIQQTQIVSALGVLIPVDMVVDVVNPIPNELTVNFNSALPIEVLDENQVVIDTGTDIDITAAQANQPLFIREITPTAGQLDVTVTATSDVGDGSPISVQDTIEISYIDSSQSNIIGSMDNELILGSDLSEVLQGGGGEDIFTGGDGNDIFVWTGTEKYTGPGTITDSITDFNNNLDAIIDANEDQLNLADLLDYDSNTDNITDFLEVTFDGQDSNIAINSDGQINVTGIQQNILMEGINLVNGNLTQTDILNQLIQNQVIIVDV